MPFGLGCARKWGRAAIAAGVGVILTISAQDARAQTADTLCALGKRAQGGITPAASLEDPAPLGARGAPLDATFTDEDGEEVSLSDYRGAVVVLNFWATWCAPCVREMPSLDELAGAVDGDDIQVLAVSQDRGGVAKVAPFYEGAGIVNLPILLDPGMETGRAFKIRGLPTTIILDAEGREVARHEGYRDWSDPAVQAMLRGLAREGKARDTRRDTGTRLAAR